MPGTHAEKFLVISLGLTLQRRIWIQRRRRRPTEPYPYEAHLFSPRTLPDVWHQTRWRGTPQAGECFGPRWPGFCQMQGGRQYPR